MMKASFLGVHMDAFIRWVGLTSTLVAVIWAAGQTGAANQESLQTLYKLGPDDQLTIRVLNLEEIGTDSYRIDSQGNIDVPLIGKIHAGGLTVDDLQGEIKQRLTKELKAPTVTVSIKEFRSQPVSVLGAVITPGVHQVHGPTTLFEVLSAAGGLKQDAGNTIHIIRRKDAGMIPLPGARPDGTGKFYVAELKVRSVMEGKNPEDNILVMPEDVISVPKGEMVYVVGAVHRPGGFVLNEKETISILEALSLAEGIDRGAGPSKARILRLDATGNSRTQIPVDVTKILAGKSADVPLIANDVLFLPTSASKNAALRAVEAAITVGTGVAIYRP
jgi:polysaccharide export outer membrane protein